MSSQQTINRLAITDEDIAAGEFGKADECPIALAANRAFETEGCMFVDANGEWELRNGGDRYEVVGGPEFAIAFDQGDPVEPCELLIERIEDDDEDGDHDD